MVLLQEGSELSLAELRQMAARQQHQIEAHQQLLVAKEQRLKFLKQQEVRHQQQQQQQQHNMVSSVDADRLRHLKEKVELQELKLRRLRALRGQVEQHRSNNTNLSAELESIRALFNEKEKELSMAVAKVEELTRQLEDVRRGDMSGLRQGGAPSPAALEFQKLRRELLYRSKLNEQQNARIAQQRETLARRQSEISQMDQRIAELQQRLQRKRLLNQQLSSQLHAASRARPRANIAAVEPLKRAAQEIELIQDDLKVSAEAPEFTPNKKDPKYQTLPYNTKFSGTGNQDSHKLQNGEFEKHQLQNGGPPPYPDPPNSRLQPPNKPSPPHGLGNFSPRPFGTTYSTSSFLNSENGSRNRPQMPLKNPVVATSTTVSSSSISPSKPTITNSTSVGLHRPKPGTSFPSHQTVLPPTVMTSQTGAIRTVPQTPARQHPSPGYIHSHHLRLNENSPKPSVPPKPGIPSKPVLPPRQTYGSGVSPNNIQKTDPVDQALSVLKGNNTNHRTPENYRLEAKVQSSNLHPRIPPHVVIPQHSVTVTDSSIKGSKDAGFDSSAVFNHQTSSDSQESTPSSEVNSSNVRISLNRRIGMPPAFFFPENQPPPSDLGISDDSERMHLSRPRSVVLELSKLEPDGSLSATSKSTSDLKEPGVKEQSSVSGIDVLSDIPASPQKSALALSDLTDKSSSEQDSVNDSLSMCGRRGKKGNLKTNGAARRPRRVSFDPLALLLDAALEGELELVKKTAKEVPNPSAANDEGITALHNAICAGHLEIVKFLVQFGCDVNAQDSDGWTPLHCAASCNNLQMVKYLVENGACIFATTLSDHETAAEKCEKEEEGFDGCSEYLYSMQEKLGILNGGVIYALYDYENQNADELSFRDGDKIVVLRKGDELEREWWWSKLNDREGYVPRNLIGLHPRVVPKRDP